MIAAAENPQALEKAKAVLEKTFSAMAASLDGLEKSGIGRTKALEICTRVGIPLDRRANDMTDDEVLRVRELIDREYTVEGDLRRTVAMNVKRLMDLGCYRGLRHRKGLPVRGQRTHTNARTRKGPARPIAGKKK